MSQQACSTRVCDALLSGGSQLEVYDVRQGQAGSEGDKQQMMQLIERMVRDRWGVGVLGCWGVATHEQHVTVRRLHAL